MITFADKSIAWLALLSGLTISAVAVYYSVAGLVSIFAAAVIPITIMGVVLELSKLVATVWLKQNWFIAPRAIRLYLLAAVIILMIITSLGIYGYLSRAHLEQAVPAAQVIEKVAILDERIKAEKENIDSAKRALEQLDSAVEQTMLRTDDATGATRSANLRRAQARERAQYQTDIAKAQSRMLVLNEERAPLAIQLHKVEAEVGPLKYVAALIYGDDLDHESLEKAVRWVIILIVIIFDPLAVTLLLASQYSFNHFRKIEENRKVADIPTIPNDLIPDNNSTVEPVVKEIPPIEEIRIDSTEVTIDDIAEYTIDILEDGGTDANMSTKNDATNESTEVNKVDKRSYSSYTTSMNVDKVTFSLPDSSPKIEIRSDNQPHERKASVIRQDETQKKRSYIVKENDQQALKTTM